MKIVGIFNKKEEEIGFRLSGMETNLIQEKEKLINLLENLNKDSNIGILVINDGIYKLLPQEFDKMKEKRLPLLLKLN